MTPWELLVAGGLYLSVALRYWHAGDHGLAIAWACYAGANAGFILSSLFYQSPK